MRSQYLAGLLAFASCAIAAPAENFDALHDYKVSQVKAGKKWKNGAVARAQAYRKYGAEPPASVAHAAKSALAQQGSVTATPEQYDESYLCPVTVGSNQLMLDFDTGSADLWVFSTELPSSETTGHTLYTCTGTLLSGYKWKITYGDGSGAAGNVFRDKVVVGPVTATSQAVEAATSVSSQFVSDTDNDGLLGLAFSTINTVTPNKQTTFFQTVLSTLSSPLFTADLKHAAAGEYTFGYIDTSKYTGSIAYANVNNGNGFWEFTASGYSVGSGAEKKTSIDAIADTGTSLILITDAICNAYYSQVSGAYYDNSEGGYIFPCSSTLPTFSIYIGTNKRTVPGSYMNYIPIGSGYCYGGIQSSDGIGFNILGDVFLKSQYAVFDISVPRVGFAQQS